MCESKPVKGAVAGRRTALWPGRYRYSTWCASLVNAVGGFQLKILMGLCIGTARFTQPPNAVPLLASSIEAAGGQDGRYLMSSKIELQWLHYMNRGIWLPDTEMAG